MPGQCAQLPVDQLPPAREEQGELQLPEDTRGPTVSHLCHLNLHNFPADRNKLWPITIGSKSLLALFFQG